MPGRFRVLTGEPLDPARSYVFLCGHPEMIRTTSEQLAARGFVAKSKDDRRQHALREVLVSPCVCWPSPCCSPRPRLAAAPTELLDDQREGGAQSPAVVPLTDDVPRAPARCPRVSTSSASPRASRGRA